jgi:hypothetical protein
MQTFINNEERDTTVISFGAPTIERAKEILRTHNIKTFAEYKVFRQNYPYYNLPANPRMHYKEQYISVYNYFSTEPNNLRAKGVFKYWEKVRSGEIQRKPYKTRTKNTTDEVSKPVEQEQPVDDRIQLINLMRKYDILDLCADGLKSLFTYEELFKMVIK